MTGRQSPGWYPLTRYSQLVCYAHGTVAVLVEGRGGSNIKLLHHHSPRVPAFGAREEHVLASVPIFSMPVASLYGQVAPHIGHTTFVRPS